MTRHQWGFGLLGKGLLACTAVALMLGGERDASAKPVQQINAPLHQQLTDVRPAPLPTVRASAELQQNADGTTPSWVF
jgi:hypothetical protein